MKSRSVYGIDFFLVNRVDGVIELDTVLQIAPDAVFGSKKDLHAVFRRQEIGYGAALPVDGRRVGHQTDFIVFQSIFNCLNIVNSIQNLFLHTSALSVSASVADAPATTGNKC